MTWKDEPTREEAVASLKRALILDWQGVENAEELLDLIIGDMSSPHAVYIRCKQLDNAFAEALEKSRKAREEREALKEVMS